MAGINCSTYLDLDVHAAAQKIAKERRWSISQTLAILVEEAPMMRAAIGESGGTIPAPQEDTPARPEPAPAGY